MSVRVDHRSALVLCAIVTWLFVPAAPRAQEADVSADATEPVGRGEYLVMLLDCHICHSPKLPGPGMQPDMSRALSGHPADAPYPEWRPTDLPERNALTLADPGFTAWAGPWGVSFATNLTPHEDGIGPWTEEAFVQVFRTGKHQGQPNGRDILPPMPWFAHAYLPDEDLEALWAYLRTLPPVANKVPLPVPPPAPPPGASGAEQ